VKTKVVKISLKSIKLQYDTDNQHLINM